jgi:molybdenum cofactor guanylyltransferase
MLMEQLMVGIVLAGGQSRRFGSPKAFAKKEGKPFYLYSIRVIEVFTDSIILVSNSNLLDDFHNREDSSIQLITDEPKIAGHGPLAGIYSAMNKQKATWYLILPIDVPFIESWVFDKLLHYTTSGVEVIVPIVKGKIQPLISVFHASMKSKIEKQLQLQELSLKQLFDKSLVQYVEMKEEKPFININYKEDLKRYLDLENN